jgi:hypothetical protein
MAPTDATTNIRQLAHALNGLWNAIVTTGATVPVTSMTTLTKAIDESSLVHLRPRTREQK